jgi:uncharacterized protein (DUF2249 family)
MNDKTITVDVREDIHSGGEPFSKIMTAAAALQAGERLLLIAPFEPVPLFRVLEKQGFVHTGQANAAGDWEILFTRDCIGAPSALGEFPKAASDKLPSGATNEERAQDGVGRSDSVHCPALNSGSDKPPSRVTNEERAQGGVGRSDSVRANGDLSLLTSILRSPATEDGSAATEIVDVDARGLEPPQPLVTILESLAALPPGAELRACTDRRPMHLYAQLEERGFNSVTEEQSDGSFFTHIRRR